MLPIHQVAADGMTPTHVTPRIAKRIELKKQMVLTLGKHQAIRVIDPIFGRCEMKTRAVRIK
jgi:hypothetical protein